MKAIKFTEMSPFDISQFIHERYYNFRQVPVGQTVLVDLQNGQFFNSQGKPSRHKAVKQSGSDLLEELKIHMADKHTFGYTFEGVLTEEGHLYLTDCVTGDYLAQPQEFRELTLRALYPQGGGKRFTVVHSFNYSSHKNAMVRSLEEGTTTYNLQVVNRYAPYSNEEFGNYYFSKPLPPLVAE